MPSKSLRDIEELKTVYNKLLKMVVRQQEQLTLLAKVVHAITTNNEDPDVVADNPTDLPTA